MKIKPIGKRILAKKVITETKTVNGLYIPDSMQKRDRFEIIDIGDVDVLFKCKNGDIVYIEKYAGYEITQGDQTYVVLKADDIIAKEVE